MMKREPYLPNLFGAAPPRAPAIDLPAPIDSADTITRAREMRRAEYRAHFPVPTSAAPTVGVEVGPPACDGCAPAASAYEPAEWIECAECGNEYERGSVHHCGDDPLLDAIEDMAVYYSRPDMKFEVFTIKLLRVRELGRVRRERA